MSYISRDRLLNDIFDATVTNKLEDSRYVLSIFREMVRNQPTADVVEVVRCKDCKRREFDTFGRMVCVRNGQMIEIEENDYCSYGKSQKEEQNGRMD